MKFEEQVCSLQIAKKLKELGVRQESLFWWLEVWTWDKRERYWHVVRKRLRLPWLGRLVSGRWQREPRMSRVRK